MDIGNPREFYFGLPVVTRLWVTAGVITTVGAALGMVPVQMLNLNWAAVLYRVQIWRLLTNVMFLGKLGIGFLFNVFWLLKHSGELEVSPFPSAGSAPGPGTSADYAWMLVFSTLLLGALNGLVVLLGSVGMAPAWLAMWALSRGSLLGEALLSVIIWVWSRRFPTKPAGVFMFKAPGFYFPWLVLVFNLVLGADPTPFVFGYFVGAVYVLLVDTLPSANATDWGMLAGARVFYTPVFMEWLVDWAGGRAPQVARQNPGFGGPGRRVNQ